MNGPMLANRSHERRGTEHPSDHYQTPADVTHALLNFLDLPKGLSIWEPACGDGAMSAVLSDRGFKVFASDIRPDASGINDFPMDFLTEQQQLFDFHYIITNPPFNHAEAFVKRALWYCEKLRGSPRPILGVAMLVKSQFWHAQKRLDLFREYQPSYVLPLTWRPDFLGLEKARPTMEVMWCVWDGDGRAGRTAYIPLPKPARHV